MKMMFIGIGVLMYCLASCNLKQNTDRRMSSQFAATLLMNSVKTDTATLGTGCFWCTEAIFQQLKGVLKVESGYSGGHVDNPSYEAVTTGTTGHAEVVQIVYDP